MIRFDDSVVIHAPVETVFGVVTDFRNTPTWHKNMKEVGYKRHGAPALGAEYVWIEGFMGTTLDLSGVITAWDPPNGFSWRPVAGPYDMSGGWSFTPVRAATRVTRTADPRLSGALQLIAGLATWIAKRQVRQELAHLKRFVEAGEHG